MKVPAGSAHFLHENEMGALLISGCREEGNLIAVKRQKKKG
jgi:hypothetical protein